MSAQLLRYKLNNFILYVDIISAYCESHRKSINVEPLSATVSATVSGTYRNYCSTVVCNKRNAREILRLYIYIWHF